MVECIGGEADIDDFVALDLPFHITFELPRTISTMSMQLRTYSLFKMIIWLRAICENEKEFVTHVVSMAPQLI